MNSSRTPYRFVFVAEIDECLPENDEHRLAKRIIAALKQECIVVTDLRFRECASPDPGGSR